MGVGRAAPLPDEQLVERSLELASELAVRAVSLTGRRELRRMRRLRRILASDSGTGLVFSLADRVLRPFDPPTAARQLAAVVDGPLPGTSRWDGALLRLGGVAGRVAPAPVVALVGARLRRETGTARLPGRAGPARSPLWPGCGGADRRPNLNLLGEAILGWGEAGRRAGGGRGAPARGPTSTASRSRCRRSPPGLSLIDFEGSVRRGQRAASAPLPRAPASRRPAQAREPGHGGAPGPRSHRRAVHAGPRRARVRGAHRPASRCRPTCPTPTPRSTELLDWARRHAGGSAAPRSGSGW